MYYLDKLSIQIGYKSYKDFLQGDYWKKFSSTQRKNQCFCCEKQGFRLHVHHITYVRLGSERPFDVITVCRGCHYAIHKSVREKKVKLLNAHIRLRNFRIREKFFKKKFKKLRRL